MENGEVRLEQSRWRVANSEDGLNISVYRNMRLRESVDFVICPSSALEVKIPADVVVFIEGAEDAFDLFR
jgi:uncharacterized protein (DUF2384 family)